MGITSNAGQIAERMRRRPAAVVRELEKVARDFAPRFEAKNRAILRDRIYSVSVPYRKAEPAKGRPTARRGVQRALTRNGDRTGELLRREKAVARGLDIVMTNDSDHARARYNLGTPEGRKIVSPGVQSVQWHRLTWQELGPKLLEARRRAIQRGLQQR